MKIGICNGGHAVQATSFLDRLIILGFSIMILFCINTLIKGLRVEISLKNAVSLFLLSQQQCEYRQIFIMNKINIFKK